MVRGSMGRGSSDLSESPDARRTRVLLRGYGGEKGY
jgi:hypothetical protein